MIAIAVAASIIVYVWSIGLLGGLMGGGGSQVKEQLIMEAYSWPTVGGLAITVRNVGSSSVTIASSYVNGVKQTPTWLPVAVDPGATSTTTVTITGFTPTSGVAYTIKIVSSTGGVFAFTATYGSSG
jgi:P pilus assembly chaperone PapD